MPRGSFDMVYSRFLLCHVNNPLDALKEMGALLRNGGVLVSEDYDYASIASEPPTQAYGRLVEIIRNMDAKRGVDSAIGSKLRRLFGEAGFVTTETSVKETARQRGEEKRFWELTLREAAPAIIEAGVARAEELESICGELQAIARDETTLVTVARVFQVWSRKG